MRKRSSTLTEQELAIMKIVWGFDGVSVRDVYEALLKKRRIAYTTVMTMMNVLVDKGHLAKNKSSSGAFEYAQTKKRAEVERSMIHEFLGRVFDGSPKPMLLQLVEDEKLSREDLDEIRRMIREKS